MAGLAPGTPSTLTAILTILGVGQYRVGAYADALDTLKQAEKMRTDRNLGPDPNRAAFTAMTQCQLGRMDEGRSAISAFRDTLERMTFADFTSGKLSCWIEAEKVFAGNNDEILAIWELIGTKEFDRAVETFTELQHAPKETDSQFTFSSEGIARYLSRICYVRGKSCLVGKEPDYVKRASDYEAAIRVDPDYIPPLKELAWLRATCAIEEVKDVKRAVELARLACERTAWKNHECLSVLAGAYAESGNFTDAVRWQREAIGLLPAEDQAKWGDNYSERLRLYQSDMSYRASERWNFTGDISSLPGQFFIQTPSKYVGISFSPDGRRFITKGYVRVVLTLWDAMAGVELRRLTRVPRTHDFAFSPDGKRIALAEGRDTASVWDAETGEQLTVFRGHDSPVVSVAYSPDGRRIASSSREIIRIWDAATGTELMRLEDEKAAAIRSLTYSPDGSRLISYGGDNIIRVWDVASGRKILAIEKEGQARDGIAISRDGKLIALSGVGSMIPVWDATNGRQLMTLRGHNGAVGAVSFSPVADRLVSCSDEDGTVKVWDTTTGLELVTLVGEDVYDVAFSPNGSTIAAVCREGIILWETKEPVGGLGPRRKAQAVRQLVRRLHQKCGTYQEVVDQLSGDDTLDESVREMALQIVDSRIPQEAYDVAWNVLTTIVPSEKDTQEYQAALVKLEKANRLVPDHWTILTALGAVQCRLGSYDDALKTLAKSAEIYSDSGNKRDPVSLAFRAMALHGIGQVEEAKAALVQLREELDQRGFGWTQPILQPLLPELEGLIEGTEP
jgi:tetratricopeptide (TPR) repeat protein/Tol biopolymer transport system component